MADRRSQSDESLIVEYFTVQPLAACDALLNQIGDILRRRRPKRSEAASNSKSATEPTERKPSQKRKAGKEIVLSDDCTGCTYPADHNIHHLPTTPNFHELQPAGEAKGASG